MEVFDDEDDRRLRAEGAQKIGSGGIHGRASCRPSDVSILASPDRGQPTEHGLTGLGDVFAVQRFEGLHESVERDVLEGAAMTDEDAVAVGMKTVDEFFDQCGLADSRLARYQEQAAPSAA
ncbi:hypothetical protein GCM10009796_05770 [Microbacterium koreense]